MDIRKAYDKVMLTNAEIQEALREYVHKKTGRTVRGHVICTAHENSNKVGKEFYPQTEGGGSCYLEEGFTNGSRAA